MNRKIPVFLCMAGLLAFAGVTNAEDSKLWKAKSPFLKGVQEQPHLEPAIPHPAREKGAGAKLKALEAKAGQKPNFLVIYVDDMGWGDPGVYGGGAAIGAPTPNIDSLAHDGLMMTSAYSQPACTPPGRHGRPGACPSARGSRGRPRPVRRAAAWVLRSPSPNCSATRVM